MKQPRLNDVRIDPDGTRKLREAMGRARAIGIKVTVDSQEHQPARKANQRRIKYFQQTDTLYIELSEFGISETRDLDEDVIADLDAEGRICALTIEHACIRADILHFSFEQVAA